MFYGCSSLKSLDLSNFDTSKVTYMSYMFYECTSLESLDISNFYTLLLDKNASLFSNNVKLQYINLLNYIGIDIFINLYNFKNLIVCFTDFMKINNGDNTFKKYNITIRCENTTIDTINTSSPEKINETIIPTNIIISPNATDILSPFILGFDKYVHSSTFKKVTFNCYFSITKETFFPKVMHFFVIVKYRTYINLHEEEKSLCNLVNSNIKYQVKYECELEINENDILNVKSLDKFEYDSKTVEIKNSSFLYSLYKNNMQKCSRRYI